MGTSRSAQQWKELCSDAVQALRVMRSGEMTDGEWRNIDTILMAYDAWVRDDAAQRQSSDRPQAGPAGDLAAPRKDGL